MSHSGLISCLRQICPFHNPGTQRCTVEYLSVNCCTNHLKQEKVDCLLSFSRSRWAKCKLRASLPKRAATYKFQWMKKNNKLIDLQCSHFLLLNPAGTLSENSLLQIARLTTPPANNHKPSNNQFSQDVESPIPPSILQDVATAVQV